MIVPLFVTQAIDLHQFEKTMLVAPPPPAAPPVIHAQAVVPKQAFLHPLLTAPTIIPKKIVETASDIGAAAPSISIWVALLAEQETFLERRLARRHLHRPLPSGPRVRFASAPA